MEAKLNTGMNEICAMSDDELDAVSGAAQRVMFDFKVAGMSIKGGYDDENGSYGVVVKYGDKFVAQGWQSLSELMLRGKRCCNRAFLFFAHSE